MKTLTKEQILGGIEDLVHKKLKWAAAFVTRDGRISGMIIGEAEFVEMMKSAAEGKSRVPKEELN